MPLYFPEDDDPKATGVRRKKARYTEMVQKVLNMTSDAIHWDLSSILPDMPPLTIEQYTQTAGWSALIKKDGKYHLVSGICAGFIGEWTEYFMPKGVIVSNPYAKDIDGQYIFGEDAVLLRNDSNMMGLFPIICPRAEMMTETQISMLTGLTNLRIINIIHAATDSMKSAAESFFRQIRFGRSGIITGSDSRNRWSGGDNSPVIENLPTGGVPTNYMIQFIESAQYIRGSLFNDLGLQYNSNMKREALNSSETNMNEDALHPIIENMMECRKRFVQDVKDTFGVDIPEPELFGAWARRHDAAENAAASPQEENPQPEEKPETLETESEVTEDEQPENTD